MRASKYGLREPQVRGWTGRLKEGQSISGRSTVYEMQACELVYDSNHQPADHELVSLATVTRHVYTQLADIVLRLEHKYARAPLPWSLAHAIGTARCLRQPGADIRRRVLKD